MKIKQREIRVNEAVLMLDEPYAKVWFVDLASKYAHVLQAGPDEVLLNADSNTLGVDQEHRLSPTALVLGLPWGWNVTAQCIRYTCRVVAYRLPHGALDGYLNQELAHTDEDPD